MISLTLKDKEKGDFRAGIIYFRFVEEPEMKEWINEEFLAIQKLTENFNLLSASEESGQAIQLSSPTLSHTNIFSSIPKEPIHPNSF